MQVKNAENNVYTKKPSKLNNLVKGAVIDLKLLVPVLSQYTMGDYYSKQTEIAQNLTGLQDGKKAGTLKKIVSGAVKQFVYTLPILGTYQVGKAKVNHENLKNVIEADKKNAPLPPKKKGIFKTYFKGLAEKFKLCIPVYGTYYAGKISNETNNMLKDSKIIKAQNK